MPHENDPDFRNFAPSRLQDSLSLSSRLCLRAHCEDSEPGSGSRNAGGHRVVTPEIDGTEGLHPLRGRRPYGPWHSKNHHDRRAAVSFAASLSHSVRRNRRRAVKIPLSWGKKTQHFWTTARRLVFCRALTESADHAHRGVGTRAVCFNTMKSGAVRGRNSSVFRASGLAIGARRLGPSASGPGGFESSARLGGGLGQ